MCTDVRQDLRSSAIFTTTATRAILTAFDAKLSKTTIDDGHIVETNSTKNACHYQNNWLWSPNEGFNMEWGKGWDSELEFGFWITAFQVLWVLLLILR